MIPAEDWLAPIRARANAATPGPWFQGRKGVPYETETDVYSKRDPSEPDSHDIATLIWSAEDAALIAHAPADLARLLDEVDRLRATLERVRALLGEDYQRSGREVSCGGYLVTDDGCFAGSLARRITAALDGQVAP